MVVEKQERSFRWLPVMLWGAILAIDPPARADTPAPPASDATEAADEAEARAHFKRGVELRDGGAWDQALTEFRAALTLYPRRLSIALAVAGCLRTLKRYDEALDLLEPLVLSSGATLGAAAKASLQSTIAELRLHVGTIILKSGEAGATVVIDDRYRGMMPLPAPLRAVEGNHVIRIFKEGSDPLGAVVEVVGGQAVVARLASISTTHGRLRVTEERNRALDVVLDGRVVGKTPWEGSVAEGDHLVELHGEATLGTAPVSVSVAVRRLTPLKLLAEDLSATLRVEPVPAGASVAIDAVSVGRGVWEGHLRLGRHQIEVAATGFLSSVRSIDLQRGARAIVTVALLRDAASPFWRRPPRFTADLSAGALLVPSFAGGVASGCAGKCSGGIGVGSYGALRGGYELGSGVGFGLSIGALTAVQQPRGRPTSLNIVGRRPATTSAEQGNSTDAGLTDNVLDLRGVTLGGWLGYSIDVGLPLHFRLGAGGLFGSTSDTRRGDFTASNGAPYTIGPYVEKQAARFVFLTPEVRVGLPLGKHVELNAGLEVPILFAASRMVWSGKTHAINAGPDGYGWFDQEAFVGSAVVTLAPTVGARFDL